VGAAHLCGPGRLGHRDRLDRGAGELAAEQGVTIRKGALVGIGLLIPVAAAWLYYQMRSHPALDAYAPLSLAVGTHPQSALRATFLGVATILLDDGETAILTDGFFTRPSIGQLFFGKIAPDKALIPSHLRHARVGKLAAVIVNHSHYDHVMDAREVAIETGALLVGSESTANVGRGWGSLKSASASRRRAQRSSSASFA